MICRSRKVSHFLVGYPLSSQDTISHSQGDNGKNRNLGMGANPRHGDPLISGVVEELSYVNTLELAYKLYPRAHRVVAVLDNSMTGEGERMPLSLPLSAGGQARRGGGGWPPHCHLAGEHVQRPSQADGHPGPGVPAPPGHPLLLLGGPQADKGGVRSAGADGLDYRAVLLEILVHVAGEKGKKP